jgi:hypothetical protein
MSTHNAYQQPRNDDAALYLGVVLLVIFPAVLAFICSKWFPYGSPHFTSGLWFFYEASRGMAYLGIVLAVVFTVAAVIQRTVSRKMAMLMALTTFAASALLWYAIHMYLSPWQ